ncbi:MAG: hypothetical protein ACOZCL_04695 [Bacillota bacterium]
MSVIDKLACRLGRRDEVPNIELANELALREDKAGVDELVKSLWGREKDVQSDSIKTLYSVGSLKPELIAGYADDFIKLLRSRNNRMVWGAMMALATIADIKSEEIFKNLDIIYSALSSGSVITVDNGVKVLAKAASAKREYSEKIFPYLLNHLKKCRPKEIPQHAESMLSAVNPENKSEFLAVLSVREDSMSETQQKRVKKICKLVEKL